MILAFKLIVTPFFIGAVTLAGQVTVFIFCLTFSLVARNLKSGIIPGMQLNPLPSPSFCKPDRSG
jgi:hypothetical protein